MDKDSIIDAAASTPISAKKMPKLLDTSVKVPNAKQRAVALIEEAFQGAKIDKMTLMRRQAKEPMAVFQAFQNFEAALGGRQKLIDILQYCPENSNGHALIKKLLEDPDFMSFAASKDDAENVGYALSVLCTRHKLPLNTLVQAFQAATTAKVALATLTATAEHVPEVIGQIIEDAKNRFDACTICAGSGRIWRIREDGEWLFNDDGEHVTQLCHNCRGTGKIFKEHDTQSRQQFLKLTGLIDDSRKVPLVNINQQTAIIKKDFLPGDGSFENLLKAVDAVTSNRPDREETVDIPYVVYDIPVDDVEKESPNPTS